MRRPVVTAVVLGGRVLMSCDRVHADDAQRVRAAIRAVLENESYRDESAGGLVVVLATAPRQAVRAIASGLYEHGIDVQSREVVQ